MTRAGAIGIALGLICISFPAGWVLSKFDSRKSAMAMIASIEASHADTVKDLRERPSIPLFTEPDGQWMDQEDGLKKFEPSGEDSITLTQGSGLGFGGRVIEVCGNGVVTVSDSSGTKQVATLSKADCADFFRKVIANGLAGYSEEAVQLKRDLAYPETTYGRTCAGDTGFRISIPSLEVDREFSIHVPEIEVKNYPDIIEYRSAEEIEKEILGFVP